MKCLLVGHEDVTESIVEEAIMYSGFHITDISLIGDGKFENCVSRVARKYQVLFHIYERKDEPIERVIADRDILEHSEFLIIIAHYLTPRMRKLIDFAKELSVTKYIYRSNWINRSIIDSKRNQ